MGTLIVFAFWGACNFFPSFFFFLRAVTASSTEAMKGGVLIYNYAL